MEIIKLNNKLKESLTSFSSQTEQQKKETEELFSNAIAIANAINPKEFKKIISPVEKVILKMEKALLKEKIKFEIFQNERKLLLYKNSNVQFHPLKSSQELAGVLNFAENHPYFYIILAYISIPVNFSILQVFSIYYSNGNNE